VPTASGAWAGLAAATAAATATVGSYAWNHRGESKPDSSLGSKVLETKLSQAQPLVEKEGPDGSDSGRSTEVPASTARSEVEDPEQAEVRNEDSHAEEDNEEEQAITYSDAELKALDKRKKRDPLKGLRTKFLLAARKRTASWVTVLVHGVEMVVNGELTELKLQRPRWTMLQIGKEVFPLAGIALQLDAEVLKLVVANSELNQLDGAQDKDARVFCLTMESAYAAMELALALKTARASADTGAGIGAWGDRHPDSLKRPPPAE